MQLNPFSQTTTAAYLLLKSTNKRTKYIKRQFSKYLTSGQRTMITEKSKEMDESTLPLSQLTAFREFLDIYSEREAGRVQ